jgi:hypothetical protein
MKNLLLYGGVRHGYAQPGNGNDPSRSSQHVQRARRQAVRGVDANLFNAVLRK